MLLNTTAHVLESRDMTIITSQTGASTGNSCHCSVTKFATRNSCCVLLACLAEMKLHRTACLYLEYRQVPLQSSLAPLQSSHTHRHTRCHTYTHVLIPQNENVAGIPACHHRLLPSCLSKPKYCIPKRAGLQARMQAGKLHAALPIH